MVFHTDAATPLFSGEKPQLYVSDSLRDEVTTMESLISHSIR